MEPKDPIYRINLASVALKLNDFKEAELILKQTLELDNDNAALANIALAKLYLSTKKFELAHKSVDAVLAVAPFT